MEHIPTLSATLNATAELLKLSRFVTCTWAGIHIVLLLAKVYIDGMVSLSHFVIVTRNKLQCVKSIIPGFLHICCMHEPCKPIWAKQLTATTIYIICTLRFYCVQAACAWVKVVFLLVQSSTSMITSVNTTAVAPFNCETLLNCRRLLRQNPGVSKPQADQSS